ncbi:MAG: hypothetical protein RR141_03095, partial [Rikenellaceae bacterium]
NITLGNNSDGEPCYVIGGAGDYGLWFRHKRAYGYVYESDSGVSWKPSSSRYYIPERNGDKVKAVMGTLTNYEAIFNAEYSGSASADDNPIDPCSLVYTGDPKVKWRTPNYRELNTLVKSAEWVTTFSGEKGVLCTSGLFLRCAGGRNGGNTNSSIRGTESSGGPMALYWTSDVIPGSTGFNTKKAYGTRMVYGNAITVNDVIMNTANSVRCVRDI